MIPRSLRLTQILMALLTFGVVIASFYFQYVKGFEPCPLCMMQRACVGVLLLLCLISMMLKSFRPSRVMILLQGFFALSGLFFALRQLWLQSVATPESSMCLPGLDMLVQLFPWRKLVHLFLWGSNSCGEVVWYGFGLSMAAWSALYFGLMILACAVILYDLFCSRAKFN